MGITSLEYILFCMITVILYYCIPVKIRWVLLLALSIIYFSLAGEPILFLYPVITVYITWICTNRMEKEKTDSKGRKVLLTIALSVNFGVLCVLKYLNLGIYTFNVLTDAHVLPLRFIVPVGISFYTMSMMSYVFDVYYDIDKPEKNYFRLLLFGTYFPLLVSGPIVRYKDTARQLRAETRFDQSKAVRGLLRLLWGLFEVLVISERLAVISNTIFADNSDYRGVYILLGASCFTLRLYTNFSGTMDIVLGFSGILGIELPENFNRPFASETIQEFWQRWHITLGGWLRDYIMYPLLRSGLFVKISKSLISKVGKKKGKQITTFTAMFILWLIAGLWHGGAWKYIWGVGILQWLYIVIGELTRSGLEKLYKNANIDPKCYLLVILRRIRTFLLMSIALIFFNAQSLRTGFRVIINIFSSGGGDLGLGLDTKNLAILAASLIMWGLVAFFRERKIKSINDMNMIVRWAVLYGLIFTVILFGSYGPGYSAAEFIYQGF